MPQRISKKTLYLNADKSKLLNEGDPDAAFLFVREGSAVNESEYARLEGLGVDMKAVSTDESDEFDAKAAHEALHAGETDEEAKAKRDALFSKSRTSAPANKAKKAAPEDKGA